MNATRAPVTAATDEEAAATERWPSLQRQSAADLVLLPMTQSDEYVLTAPAVRDVGQLVRAGLAARILGDRQWLSWPHRRPGPASGSGPLRPGERVTLTDPKGRRHSILLAAGGAFHTTKGVVATTT